MKKEKRLVAEKFGHIHLLPKFRKLLVQCIAKESTRYAIARVFIGPRVFAATDGRRLLIVKFKHDFGKGLYFVTKDGYCLKDVSGGRFPKYTDIIPKSEKVRTIWTSSGMGNRRIASIVYELNRAGSLFDLDMLIPFLKDLEKLNPDDISVDVHKKNVEETPIVISGVIGTIEKPKFIYIQMPISK